MANVRPLAAAGGNRARALQVASAREVLSVMSYAHRHEAYDDIPIGPNPLEEDDLAIDSLAALEKEYTAQASQPRAVRRRSSIHSYTPPVIPEMESLTLSADANGKGPEQLAVKLPSIPPRLSRTLPAPSSVSMPLAPGVSRDSDSSPTGSNIAVHELRERFSSDPIRGTGTVDSQEDDATTGSRASGNGRPPTGSAGAIAPTTSGMTRRGSWRRASIGPISRAGLESAIAESQRVVMPPIESSRSVAVPVPSFFAHYSDVLLRSNRPENAPMVVRSVHWQEALSVIRAQIAEWRTVLSRNADVLQSMTIASRRTVVRNLYTASDYMRRLLVAVNLVGRPAIDISATTEIMDSQDSSSVLSLADRHFTAFDADLTLLERTIGEIFTSPPPPTARGLARRSSLPPSEATSPLLVSVPFPAHEMPRTVRAPPAASGGLKTEDPSDVQAAPAPNLLPDGPLQSIAVALLRIWDLLAEHVSEQVKMVNFHAMLTPVSSIKTLRDLENFDDVSGRIMELKRVAHNLNSQALEISAVADSAKVERPPVRRGMLGDDSGLSYFLS